MKIFFMKKTIDCFFLSKRTCVHFDISGNEKYNIFSTVKGTFPLALSV